MTKEQRNAIASAINSLAYVLNADDLKDAKDFGKFALVSLSLALKEEN